MSTTGEEQTPPLVSTVTPVITHNEQKRGKNGGTDGINEYIMEVRPDGSRVQKSRVCWGSYKNSNPRCKFTEDLGVMHERESCDEMRNYFKNEQTETDAEAKRAFLPLSETNSEKYEKLVSLFTAVLAKNKFAVADTHCVLCAGFDFLWNSGIIKVNLTKINKLEWRNHTASDCGLWAFSAMCVNCVQTSVAVEILQGTLNVFHEGLNRPCTNCWCENRAKLCIHAVRGCSHKPGNIVTYDDAHNIHHKTNETKPARKQDSEVAKHKAESNGGIVTMCGSIQSTKKGWNKVLPSAASAEVLPPAATKAEERPTTPVNQRSIAIDRGAPVKAAREQTTRDYEPVPFIQVILDELSPDQLKRLLLSLHSGSVQAMQLK